MRVCLGHPCIAALFASAYLLAPTAYGHGIEGLPGGVGSVIEIDFDRVFSHLAQSSNQSPEIIKSRFAFDFNYERHERGEIDASAYFASLRKSMGINISDEEFTAGWNSLYVGEMPGVSTLLSKVGKKLPIYAFTHW